MDINKKDNNLIVTGLKDFNLHHIFDCGQCFRFNAVSENSYFGIAKNKALLISQNDLEESLNRLIKLPKVSNVHLYR